MLRILKNNFTFLQHLASLVLNINTWILFVSVSSNSYEAYLQAQERTFQDSPEIHQLSNTIVYYCIRLKCYYTDIPENNTWLLINFGSPTILWEFIVLYLETISGGIFEDRGNKLSKDNTTDFCGILVNIFE